MYEIKIHLDTENLSVLLLNCASLLNSKRRFMLSIRRLNGKVDGNDIKIPFTQHSKITVLDDVQRILTKFSYSKALTESTTQEVESYHRDEKCFEQFSLKALNIRNNKFKDNPVLVKNFVQFKEVLIKELVRTLYPMQLLSAFHMAFAQNSCNFAVPGAGKTSIVYGAYAFLRSLPKTDPRHVNKILVVGPISSFAPWENEFEHCFGSKPNSQRLSGDPSISRERKEEHLYSGKPAELTLIFQGGVYALQSEIVDFLKSNQTMVVIDEAHRIKNPDGIWGKSAIAISKEARSRVILTGTPVPNGFEDLYNLFQFIYPYKFKNILATNFASLSELSKVTSLKDTKVVRLQDNIAPYFIRIKKSDLNLPPKKEIVIPVKMNTRQRDIYDYIETSYVESFTNNTTGTVKDVLNRAKLIRLRQAATNPALLAKPLKETLLYKPEFGEVDPSIRFTDYSDIFVDDSEYFERICDYHNYETPQKFVEVGNIIKHKIYGEKEKIIIWTIFIQNAKELQKYLAKCGFPAKLLIGEVSQEEREVLISEFNDPESYEIQIVIANPFAVSESISLHKGCHNALYLERDYNCSNFLQSKDRIHRVGLHKNQVTNYYYTIADNSIDSVIDERLQIKIKRMEAIIDEEIPLFSRINDDDETDLIRALVDDYARRA